MAMGAPRDKNDKPKVKVVFNITEDDKSVTEYSFLVTQLTQGQSLKLASDSRKSGKEDDAALAVVGTVFDGCKILSGDKSIYEVFDFMDEDHQKDFIKYLMTAATGSRAKLIGEGYEIV